MLFGPDVSNYQSQFSAADAKALHDTHLCRFVIIGRQLKNKTAQQQARFAFQAGITNIMEYLINVGASWPQLLPATKFVAVDVEPGSEFVTEEKIDEAIEWVRSQGCIPVIYSSSWAWIQLGLQALIKYGEQGVFLWNANYDGLTDGFRLRKPFGGWTHCVIDQYTDKWQDPPFAYPLDMNVVNDDFFASALDPRVAQARDILTAVVEGRP